MFYCAKLRPLVAEDGHTLGPLLAVDVAVSSSNVVQYI